MKLTKNLILGSNSPRRKEILSAAGFNFEVIVKPTAEDFDQSMALEQVPIFLAKKKADCFIDYQESNIILCADTVVINDNQILNKPLSEKEALIMLKKISGKTHEVITGVSIKIGENSIDFSDKTWVTFNNMTDAEINYYIKKYKPMDKAGAYGVQDFIGMIAISKIEGSFYTVMGLPIHKIYEKLKPYIILE
jgi:septum formation protein